MHKYAYTYIYTCIYIHTNTYTYLHASIYIYTCLYLHTYMFVTHIHTHIYTHTYNMYICTHALSWWCDALLSVAVVLHWPVVSRRTDLVEWRRHYHFEITSAELSWRQVGLLTQAMQHRRSRRACNLHWCGADPTSSWPTQAASHRVDAPSSLIGFTFSPFPRRFTISAHLSHYSVQSTPCWLHLAYFGSKTGCWRNVCHRHLQTSHSFPWNSFVTHIFSQHKLSCILSQHEVHYLCGIVP